MNEKDILKILTKTSPDVLKYHLINYDENDLRQIHSYLKLKLKRNSNWSKPKYLEFIADYKIHHPIFKNNLKVFSVIYSKNIRRLKTFNVFLSQIESLKEYLIYYDTRIEMKSEANIEAFLKTLHLIKPFLETSNEEFISQISRIINTGFTEETLLKYYYQHKI